MWFEELTCSLIWDICDDSVLSLRIKNKNDTCHSKLLDFSNNKSRIIFLWQQTICFAESYNDPEYAYSLSFDDKNENLYSGS